MCNGFVCGACSFYLAVFAVFVYAFVIWVMLLRLSVYALVIWVLILLNFADMSRVGCQHWLALTLFVCRRYKSMNDCFASFMDLSRVRYYVCVLLPILY